MPNGRPRGRAVADSLNAVRPAAEWVDSVIADAALTEDMRHDLHVCLEEALANLILHGKARDREKDIRVEVEIGAESVALVIRDRCVPFDVTDETLLASRAKGETNIGGHGVRLMRALATGLAYSSTPDGNELRITFSSRRPLEMTDADTDMIRAIPAFAGVPAAAISALREKGRMLDFAPGETLLEQGGAGDSALILLSGEVAVINASQHGEAHLARIAAPALVGEIGALAGLRRTASVRAASAVRALKIERAALLTAGRHAPELLVSVIGQLGQQLQSINSALGLYAAGFAALERDDFDPAVLDDLNNPTEDLRSFSDAFGRLARRVTQERRTRSEMASAALIQTAMLPAQLDPVAVAGRVDAYGAVKPAREVGGDLFDLFLIDNDRLAIAVGDVCGKGVPAALFMSVTVTAMRLAAQQQGDLSSLIARVNATLCAQNAMSMFSTLFYGVLDLNSRRFDYVNCGQCPPMLLTRTRDSVELPGRGPPLGLFPEKRWQSHVVQLKPGEGVLLFTDGVTESTSPQGEDYGETRLSAFLKRTRGLGAVELVNAVMAETERHAAGGEQSDDITCLAALLP